MRVFVLEDDPERIRLFTKHFQDDTWDCIHTCEREYEFKPPYDLILLDYDLGGRQLVEHEDCGLTFVKIIKDRINPEAAIIIHSYNPDGAKAIFEELKPLPARIIPFGSYWFWNTIDNVRAKVIDHWAYMNGPDTLAGNEDL